MSNRLHSPYPEIVLAKDKKFKKKGVPVFKVLDTARESLGASSWGSVDVPGEMIRVPLDADGGGVRNHEMAHATWSPLCVPKDYGYDNAFIQVCEDARIHYGLTSLGLSADFTGARKIEMELMADMDFKMQAWPDVILRSVSLSFTSHQMKVDEYVDQMPNPWRPFAIKWLRYIRESIHNMATERKRPVPMFSDLMEIATEFGRAMEEVIDRTERAKQEAKVRIAQQEAEARSKIRLPGEMVEALNEVRFGAAQAQAKAEALASQHMDGSGKALPTEVQQAMDEAHRKHQQRQELERQVSAAQDKVYEEYEKIRDQSRRAREEVDKKFNNESRIRQKGKEKRNSKTFNSDHLNTFSAEELNNKLSYKDRQIARHTLQNIMQIKQEDFHKILPIDHIGQVPLGNGGIGDAGKAYLSKPPLTVRHDELAIGMARKPRSTDEGVYLKSPHRMAIDGRIFQKKLPHRGASILIDASGSMWILDQQIDMIVRAAGPNTIVAMYFGHKKDGVVRIISKGLRRAAPQYLVRSGGENIIDVPALGWLSRQSGPRIWVSDGRVTGIDGIQYPSVTAQCNGIVEKFKIVRVENLTEAMTMINTLRVNRRAVRS